ncbi:PAS domain-containing protein [Mucilaginibacter kameinonensis]|uniref:PAS domain-containing protein n=1 Tax=Mucilaginibacter kameinonensis TaxID=452286 RepID=UPI000EF81ADD|nr:PAS domain-containing protein [Mucilaginibacter kameinonensis]
METSVTISEKDSAFNVLFYQNPLPAWIVETNTLRVIAVNDAAVSQYGYEREEFLKNTISLLNLPEENESFNTLLKKLEHNQAVKKQLTHLKKDGTPVYVNVTSYSVKFCNCCCGMIMVNGIAEKCRGVDMFNGHFTEVENLAFINSHMIRKPLANILGIIYALEACEQDECELAESINMLKLSADELDMVIRKINLQLEHRFI